MLHQIRTQNLTQTVDIRKSTHTWGGRGERVLQVHFCDGKLKDPPPTLLLKVSLTKAKPFYKKCILMYKYALEKKSIDLILQYVYK